MTKDEAESYIGKTVYSHDAERVVAYEAYEIASVRNARATYSRHYDESWKLVTKEGQTIYFTTFPTKTEALEKWVLRLIERIADNKNEIRAIELELDKNLKLLDLAQAALNAEIELSPLSSDDAVKMTSSDEPARNESETPNGIENISTEPQPRILFIAPHSQDS